MLEEFIKLIKKAEILKEEPVFYGSNSEENISKVEHTLQLKFDDFLRTYLLVFGGGGIPDLLHTNGILPADPLSDNMYTLYGATAYARQEFQLPDNFLVINSNFPSDVLVLDTHCGIIYNYEMLSQNRSSTLYPNFENYLLTEWNALIEEY
ncbi:SMI1/KNR4 family protein [Chryseobacterium sp. c4a]|uniref:SMI1/KNR4 family protein n=1 Tax=Chryseobacterium sp. c4a TaxID=1573582 RepID=UPI00135C7263|nr:SMI1/KNR4 family protein [Chryseobacterium sp. c4a]